MPPASLFHVPYVRAAHWTQVEAPPPKIWIVIHCMEYPEKPDSAEWCARYFAGKEGPAPKASAHACIDSNTIVQCVPWDQIAWHAPGANAQGIGLEHAGYARQHPSDWEDPYSQQMLDLSAWLVAQLAGKFQIPIAYVNAEGLLAGRPGITTHREVTAAFKKSTHTDPGRAFPTIDYLARARRYALASA
jgi:N-acetyl-anhydromuramyl-L-alanine amidase AmpD